MIFTQKTNAKLLISLLILVVATILTAQFIKNNKPQGVAVAMQDSQQKYMPNKNSLCVIKTSDKEYQGVKYGNVFIPEKGSFIAFKHLNKTVIVNTYNIECNDTLK